MEDTKQKSAKGRMHRGWIVLGVVGLYYATLSGLMINCIGIIFAGILGDMGFKTSELSLYYSVKSVFSALIVQKLCRMFDTCKRPNVFMAATGLIAAGSFALMTVYTSAWQWYISAILVSFAAAEMVYVVSVVINNWFAKNQGTIIGFTLMSSGISAALFGPFCSSVIANYGWRASCYVVAGISIVTWIIPCFFLLVRSPEDVGLAPIGAGEKSKEDGNGPSGHKHILPPENIWPILVIGIALPGSVSVISNQLPTFATSTGYALSVGAIISSCSMIGNMSFKPLLGMVSDRIGAVNAARIFLCIAATGLLCIMNAGGSTYVIYAGAVLYGAIFACVVTAPSLICKEVYGAEHYKERLSKSQPVSTMISAITAFAYPKLYDILGTWTPVFALCAGICFIAVICLTIAKHHAQHHGTAIKAHGNV